MIETFLLWNAAQVDIHVANYGFNQDVKQFGAQLKRQAVEIDPNYRRLLADLHTQQAPGFQTLDRILNGIITT